MFFLSKLPLPSWKRAQGRRQVIESKWEREIKKNKDQRDEIVSVTRFKSGLWRDTARDYPTYWRNSYILVIFNYYVFFVSLLLKIKKNVEWIKKYLRKARNCQHQRKKDFIVRKNLEVIRLSNRKELDNVSRSMCF